jgi:predicted transcriptional regulator
MSQSMVILPRAMSLQGAARTLARAGVSGAPVVDDSGQCIGVISTTDFMHWVENDKMPAAARFKQSMSNAWQLSDNGDRCSQVEDCMTRDPVLVKPTTRIGELARMMMEAHIHRVIVVDNATKRPLGVVSSTDILAAVARADTWESLDNPGPGTSAGDTIH